MRRITGFMGLQHIQPAPRPSALWDRMRRSMGFMGLQQILDSPSPPPLWDRVCRSMGFMRLQEILDSRPHLCGTVRRIMGFMELHAFGRSPSLSLWNRMRSSMGFMGLQHIQSPQPPSSEGQNAPQHGIHGITADSGLPLSPTLGTECAAVRHTDQDIAVGALGD